MTREEYDDLGDFCDYGESFAKMQPCVFRKTSNGVYEALDGFGNHLPMTSFRFLRPTEEIEGVWCVEPLRMYTDNSETRLDYFDRLDKLFENIECRSN